MNAPVSTSLYARIRDFFTKELWDIEKENLSKAGRFIRTQLQIIFLVIRGFIKDKCINNAASLAFATLLAIVPFLAMLFPILKIFDVQNKIRIIIADKLAAGNQEVANRIFALIDSINLKILGFAGIVFFVIVVILIISNVERKINDIWGIRRSRSLLRKFTDFFSILIIVPVFVFVSTGVTAYLQSQWFVRQILSWGYFYRLYAFLLRFSPYLSVWLALTIFYLFIPNTKVKLKPALIAGIVAGTLWQLAHWAYIHFSFITQRYNLVYGSASKLPIFMLWIFYSWIIVLFGAEIAFAYQNLKTYRLENLDSSVSLGYVQQLALNIVISISDAYYYKKELWSARMLSEKYLTSLRLVNEILFMLASEGFVMEASNPQGAYIPAFDIENMQIYDVIQKLTYKDTRNGRKMGKVLENDKVRRLLENAESALKDSLQGITVKELITTK